jgi:hypothetical protein
MNNFEAARLLVSLYAHYAEKVFSNTKYEEAIALAIGALRKENDNESNQTFCGTSGC